MSPQQTHKRSCPHSGPGCLLPSAIVLLIGKEGMWGGAELLWGDRIAPRTPDPDRDPPSVCHPNQVGQDGRSKMDRWLESEKGLPTGSLFATGGQQSGKQGRSQERSLPCQGLQALLLVKIEPVCGLCWMSDLCYADIASVLLKCA